MTDVDDAPATTGTDGTRPQVHDLRSALELLKQIPGQDHETDHPVQPIAQLAGVYKKLGAGGTVSRPTTLGPAMMFNDVEGYPGWRVLVGLMASRDRVASCRNSSRARIPRPWAHCGPNPNPPWTWAPIRRPSRR